MKRQISSMLVLPVLITALIFIPLSTPTVVSADAPAPTPVQGNCIACHEDLYFLHDTGKWYCLKESPMSCVDCHGGDPSATTREDATPIERHTRLSTMISPGVSSATLRSAPSACKYLTRMQGSARYWLQCLIRRELNLNLSLPFRPSRLKTAVS